MKHDNINSRGLPLSFRKLSYKIIINNNVLNNKSEIAMVMMVMQHG